MRRAMERADDDAEAALDVIFRERLLIAAAVPHQRAAMEQVDRLWRADVDAALQPTRYLPADDDLLHPPDRGLVLSITLLDALRTTGNGRSVDDRAVRQWCDQVTERPAGASAGAWLRLFDLASRARHRLQWLDKEYQPLSDKNAELRADLERLQAAQRNDNDERTRLRDERDRLRKRAATLELQYERLRQALILALLLVGVLVLGGLVGWGRPLAVVVLVLAVIGLFVGRQAIPGWVNATDATVRTPPSPTPPQNGPPLHLVEDDDTAVERTDEYWR